MSRCHWRPRAPAGPALLRLCIPLALAGVLSAGAVSPAAAANPAVPAAAANPTLRSAPEGTAVTPLRIAAAGPAISRSAVMSRAASWVNARPVVPYEQSHYFLSATDYYGDTAGHNPSGWREDCTGFISYAWQIAAPGTTTSAMSSLTTPISWSALQPGDALLRYDSAVHHAVLFAKWDDAAHSLYTIYHEADVTVGTEVKSGIALSNPYWSTYQPVRYHAITADPPAVPPAAHDFTADRRSDVLARDSAGTIRLYAGNGAGGFAGGYTRVGTALSSLTAMINAGDFTGDGRNDMLARDYSGNLLLYAGTGTSLASPGIKIGTGWGSLTAIVGGGDFTGDGHPDVLARDSAGTLLLYPGNGAGGFGLRRILGPNFGNLKLLLNAGDFTGDGRDDLIAADAAGNLMIYRGTATGLSMSRTTIGIGWAGMTAIIGAGDFSGDGHADLLARTADGLLLLYRGNGTGGFGLRSSIGTGWSSVTMVP
ncbi:MAG: VCBS repeat-containing protein [Actinomycetota bacterium]|nr:VCBS repeat-containing protein [Actinomycetota bacterium]